MMIWDVIAWTIIGGGILMLWLTVVYLTARVASIGYFVSLGQFEEAQWHKAGEASKEHRGP